MREKDHRRGCEFSQQTRQVVRKRARGRCEWPTGCNNRHDRTFDHITPCALGRLLGMEPKILKSVENCQMICAVHNDEKTRFMERYFIAQREYQILGGMISLAPLSA